MKSTPLKSAATGRQIKSGIIALAAIIGLSITGCDKDSSGGSGITITVTGIPTSTYTGTGWQSTLTLLDNNGNDVAISGQPNNVSSSIKFTMRTFSYETFDQEGTYTVEFSIFNTSAMQSNGFTLSNKAIKKGSNSIGLSEFHQTH
ncbi:MAG: hypothetical protein FWG54_00035 [Bacteroidetes bacterium]|nr:hypothetical protein [Bacteroidota bacterium]